MSFEWRPPWIAPILVAAALASCGDGESDTETDATTATGGPSPTEATQPLSEQIPVFERAVAHPRCDDALEVIHPVVLPDPENPASTRNCRDAVYLLKAEEGVEVTGSEELGSGGIVTTVLSGRDESLIWALDEEGRFKWTGSFIGTASPGEELASDAEFQTTADAFVEALRDEDCRAAFDTLASDSRVGQGGKGAFCDSFDATFTATPEALASRLKEDPDAEPVLLGRTEDLAVFGLATAPAGYRTLFVGVHKPGAEPVVIDAIPTER